MSFVSGIISYKKDEEHLHKFEKCASNLNNYLFDGTETVKDNDLYLLKHFVVHRKEDQNKKHILYDSDTNNYFLINGRIDNIRQLRKELKIESNDVNAKSGEKIPETGKLQMNSSDGGDGNRVETNQNSNDLNLKKGVNGVSNDAKSGDIKLVKGTSNAFQTIQSNVQSVKKVTSITPERRGRQVIVTGNNNKNSANFSQQGTGGKVTIVKKDNVFKKLLDLALSS